MAKNLGVLVGFFGALLGALLGFLTFALSGQVAYVVFAVTDDSVWTPDLKYINETAADLDAEANLRDVYSQAKTQRDADLTSFGEIINAGALVISLISLVIVITLFFMKGGILSMLKDLGGNSRED